MVNIALDHLVVTARTLQAGVDHVQDRLGVRMSPGGRHPAMGTHNALLSLGAVYLEVIAIDPDATAPGRARWFGLDHFDGPPSLSHWVMQTSDLDATLARAPKGAGRVIAVTRGDLNWNIAVPDDGMTLYDGAFPGLIEWPEGVHPAARLPDAGCRLSSFRITHPDGGLSTDLSRLASLPGVRVTQGASKGMRAEIATNDGIRILT